jgi:hypothetical protein
MLGLQEFDHITNVVAIEAFDFLAWETHCNYIVGDI